MITETGAGSAPRNSSETRKSWLYEKIMINFIFNIKTRIKSKKLVLDFFNQSKYKCEPVLLTQVDVNRSKKIYSGIIQQNFFQDLRVWRISLLLSSLKPFIVPPSTPHPAPVSVIIYILSWLTKTFFGLLR